jgi:hypothetical protein
MTRRIKILLAWLLLAALPLQGMASAVQAFCGASHHASASATAEQHAGHPAEHAEHHHDQARHADGSASKHIGSCSACASCCVGAAAMVSGFSVAVDTGPAVSEFLAPSSSFSGFVPARLERPPRVLLS